MLAVSIVALAFAIAAPADERTAGIDLPQQMASDQRPAQPNPPLPSLPPRAGPREESPIAAPGDAHQDYFQRHHFSRASLLLRYRI